MIEYVVWYRKPDQKEWEEQVVKTPPIYEKEVAEQLAEILKKGGNLVRIAKSDMNTPPSFNHTLTRK